MRTTLWFWVYNYIPFYFWWMFVGNFIRPKFAWGLILFDWKFYKLKKKLIRSLLYKIRIFFQWYMKCPPASKITTKIFNENSSNINVQLYLSQTVVKKVRSPFYVHFKWKLKKKKRIKVFGRLFQRINNIKAI